MCEDYEKSNIVRVSLMGEMVIEFQNRILKMRELNSKKITLLLAYLFYHHRRIVDTMELADVLWGEDESVNPGGHLKI